MISGLATLLVSITAATITLVGAWIASQQMLIAKNKLIFDLYKQRFGIFECTNNIIERIIVDENVTPAEVKVFVLGTLDSIFLLNDNITTYLNEIRVRASSVHVLNESIPETNDPIKIADIRFSIRNEVSWFENQPTILVDKFKPFLQLKEPSRLGTIFGRMPIPGIRVQERRS